MGPGSTSARSNRARIAFLVLSRSSRNVCGCPKKGRASSRFSFSWTTWSASSSHELKEGASMKLVGSTSSAISGLPQ